MEKDEKLDFFSLWGIRQRGNAAQALGSRRPQSGLEADKAALFFVNLFFYLEISKPIGRGSCSRA